MKVSTARKMSTAALIETFDKVNTLGAMKTNKNTKTYNVVANELHVRMAKAERLSKAIEYVLTRKPY